MAPLRAALGLLLACLPVAFLGPTASVAATSTVNCPGDDLQAAITVAAPGDTLTISGTCAGMFTVTKRLTLVGIPGATLDGAQAGTTLTVTAHRRVTLIGLTITGGSDIGDGDGAGIHNTGRLVIWRSVITENRGDLDSSTGGGISNSGSLVIHGSIVKDNSISGFFTEGGGVYNTGELTIWGSRLIQNTAYEGGNLWNSGVATVRGSTLSKGDAEGPGGIMNSGRLAVVNSTVANNTSAFIGGIINAGVAGFTNTTISGNDGTIVGGLMNSGGTTTLTSTTVSGNFSGDEFEGAGGIFGRQGSVVLRSSIVAANINTAGSKPDCSGKISSKGYSLIGDADGCTVTAAIGDQIGSASGAGVIDPRLGPLADNGGRTQTMAVLSDSPARDAIPIGSTATGGFPLCPSTGTTDQRRVPRPQGPACDVGAFERKMH